MNELVPCRRWKRLTLHLIIKSYRGEVCPKCGWSKRKRSALCPACEKYAMPEARLTLATSGVGTLPYCEAMSKVLNLPWRKVGRPAKTLLPILLDISRAVDPLRPTQRRKVRKSVLRKAPPRSRR